MSTLQILVYVLLATVALKAIIIGSDFSFSKWFKYGSDYLSWYRSRAEYQPKLDNMELTKHRTTRKV